MRQINFVIIFVICLALVLFGIENTDPAVIRVAQGIELQAPLAIELIMAMGIGAVMAWVFSVWTQLQRVIDTRKDLKVKDTRIQELEENVERYKAEIEEQQRLLPAAKSHQGAEQEAEAEVYAQ
ncbi:MAG: LapA family protein [Lyngbya sp. HA4199-MV5]|jgi:type VI protein secretion system component VasK|nr:LapA family protein [Lyngbya sp. HA4199-MV5]